jgi:pilus assembly protein Flp/PilA
VNDGEADIEYVKKPKHMSRKLTEQSAQAIIIKFVTLYYLRTIKKLNNWYIKCYIINRFKFPKNQPNLLEGFSMESIKRFIREESGVTAAEYGIILGCLGAIVVTGILAFYQNLGSIFTNWGSWFTTAAGTVPK